MTEKQNLLYAKFGVVDRHHFDADLDSDSTFHFDSYPEFTHVGKSDFFTFIHSSASLHSFYFSSAAYV
jgi:hypothetical protein